MEKQTESIRLIERKQEKNREVKLRNWAHRWGLSLHKSRRRYKTIDDYKGYMIIDLNSNIKAGEKFDLSLDDVEKYLKDEEEEKLKQSKNL